MQTRVWQRRGLGGACLAALCAATLALAACAASCGSSADQARASLTSSPTLFAQERQAAVTAAETAALRRLRTQTGFLTMRDGVRLAVTYFFPAPRTPGERLPVVLSMTPYRKDYDGNPYSYAVYPYFAERGIALAHVDVRGAGASGGLTPGREYSDAELDDLVQLVEQLAAKPWSNGKVGMMGKAWSRFNSLMTAMRRPPPALKAVLTAHATDDLQGNLMIWPNAQAMTSSLRVGDSATWLDLPTVASTEAMKMPEPVQPYDATPGSAWLASQPLTPFHIIGDDRRGITEVEEREGGAKRINDRDHVYLNVIRRWVDNRDPGRAGFVGRGLGKILLPGRTLTIRALVKVVSDAKYFHTTTTRSIYEDGKLVRPRTWREAIPRDFQ